MLHEPSGDSYGSKFTPLVVVELASDTKEEAIAWLLDRIRDKQQNGGTVVIYTHGINGSYLDTWDKGEGYS